MAADLGATDVAFTVEFINAQSKSGDALEMALIVARVSTMDLAAATESTPWLRASRLDVRENQSTLDYVVQGSTSRSDFDACAREARGATSPKCHGFPLILEGSEYALRDPKEEFSAKRWPSAAQRLELNVPSGRPNKQGTSLLKAYRQHKAAPAASLSAADLVARLDRSYRDKDLVASNKALSELEGCKTSWCDYPREAARRNVARYVHEYLASAGGDLSSELPSTPYPAETLRRGSFVPVQRLPPAEERRLRAAYDLTLSKFRAGGVMPPPVWDTVCRKEIKREYPAVCAQLEVR